jgi:glycosyltransferase involved in cell wall biosynthesis
VKVALAHDYLTQRGGAERVVASLRKAFPEAPLYTSLYDADRTFPEFRGGDVRTLALDRVGILRRHHRLALPLLARSFSRLEIDADVAICSSSGWAHGAHVRGRKIVYCHTPARWIYQKDRYLGSSAPRGARVALAAQRRFLLGWDRAAAASAARYVANSTIVRDRIRDVYGVDAQVLPPPHTIDPSGPQRPVDGVEPGFTLCVARLLPYKNVDAVIEAFAQLPAERLVVVGAGPEAAQLRRAAPRNVAFVGSVVDDQLRWLYASSRGLVAASYEDFGLTPLEAAAFGRASAVLRFGGYLDTVRADETGVFFDRPEPRAIREAIERLHGTAWDEDAIRTHAACFSEQRFIERVRALADEEAAP